MNRSIDVRRVYCNQLLFTAHAVCIHSRRPSIRHTVQRAPERDVQVHNSAIGAAKRVCRLNVVVLSIFSTLAFAAWPVLSAVEPGHHERCYFSVYVSLLLLSLRKIWFICILWTWMCDAYNLWRDFSIFSINFSHFWLFRKSKSYIRQSIGLSESFPTSPYFSKSDGVWLIYGNFSGNFWNRWLLVFYSHIFIDTTWTTETIEKQCQNFFFEDSISTINLIYQLDRLTD